MTTSKHRVCIGLTETAGVAAGLADGFHALGWNVSVVLTHQHVWAYEQPHARCRALTGIIGHLSTMARQPFRTAGRALSIPLRVLLFAVCAARNDVFVFLSRTRFVSYWELAVLRMLGKQTIEILLGSDARPPYMDGNLMRPSWNRTADDCRRLLAESTRSIRLIERFATLVVSHPPYAQLQSRRSAHVLAVGLPIRDSVAAIDLETQASRSGSAEPPVVLHSPSSPEVKGTALVRAAVDALRDEGISIDYRELHGVPNDVVIDAIASADLIVDQCYSDTPLAMFATEAAILGRPVIVGGYAWEEIDRLVPPEVVAPTIRCHPDDLAATIRTALEDRDRLEQQGAELRHFAERLRPTRVVERLVALLDGSAPESWWFEPSDVRYESGCGMSADRAVSLRQAVLGGPDAAVEAGDQGEHDPEHGILDETPL